MVGELLFHGLTFRTALDSIAQFDLCVQTGLDSGLYERSLPRVLMLWS